MPSGPGDYTYSVEYRQGWSTTTSTGTFHVQGRRSPRADPDRSTEPMALCLGRDTASITSSMERQPTGSMGWRDERVIQSSIERLHRLKINRIRVTIAGRTNVYYGEPVMAGDSWTPFITPWPTGRACATFIFSDASASVSDWAWPQRFDPLAELGRPDDIYHPGFDYSRFQVSYWQKFERAIRFARDRDVIFSLVLDMNDSRVHPAPEVRTSIGSSATPSRVSAPSRTSPGTSVTISISTATTDGRTTTGTLIKQWDPYRHLATSHPVDNVHQDRTSDWFDFTSFQEWSRTQHAFMLAQRKEQQRLGPDHPSDERGIWIRGPLPAVGQRTRIGVGRYVASDGVGDRHGRWHTKPPARPRGAEPTCGRTRAADG